MVEEGVWRALAMPIALDMFKEIKEGLKRNVLEGPFVLTATFPSGNITSELNLLPAFGSSRPNSFFLISLVTRNHGADEPQRSLAAFCTHKRGWMAIGCVHSSGFC